VRLGRPHLWIGLVSTVAVVLFAVVDANRTSPGPVTQVHAQIAAVEAGTNCSQCHGGLLGDMTSSCLDCHELIKTHIGLKEGMHGTLPDGKVEQCGLCHSEHHGAGFAIVNRQSFREAGVPDPAAFDHERVGWRMEGKHLEQECSKCHANADVGLLEAGAHRYVGLDQDCSKCHEDAHEGRMKLGCAQCHGQQGFKQLHSLGHERFLPLIGGHGDVGCRTCHPEGDAHSLEALGERQSPLEPRSCRDCHADQHDPSFLDGVSELVDLKVGAACVTCHVAAHESFRAADLTVSPEMHAASGYSLAFPHDTQACKQCHDPALPQFKDRYPGRDQDTCSACHADPHGGQFETGPFSQGDCLACHERERFAPHTIGLKEHERTELPLDGAHDDLECQECHAVPREGAARVFRGTPSDCDGCHGDAHGGFFAPFAQTLDAVPHGICASCHDTEDFTGDDYGAFDHAVHGVFAIDGAHAQAECEACHVRDQEPDPFGRTFGRIVQLRGRVEGCVTCHEDVHEGEFEGPGLPRQVEGRTGCSRCHTTASFRSLVTGWDHRRWTGFALDGEHGRLACSACHAPIRAPAGAPGTAGRTWERALGNRCNDCHEDAHAGQFDKAGSTSCERCHETAVGWDVIDFDHERESRFPLGEAHREVACASCHLPPEGGGAHAAVVYRPMEMDCVACHGTHDGPSLKRRGK
jgi:hypothetical protein